MSKKNDPDNSLVPAHIVGPRVPNPNTNPPSPVMESLDDILDVFMKDDLERMNHILCKCAEAWDRVYFVDDLAKVARTTLETIEKRRRLMLLPTQNIRDEQPKNSKYYEPIEIESDNSAGWDRKDTKILPNSH